MKKQILRIDALPTEAEILVNFRDGGDLRYHLGKEALNSVLDFAAEQEDAWFFPCGQKVGGLMHTTPDEMRFVKNIFKQARRVHREEKFYTSIKWNDKWSVWDACDVINLILQPISEFKLSVEKHARFGYVVYIRRRK